MIAMTIRPYLGLWMIALLVSCDKPRGSGDSVADNESKPGRARAKRPEREHTPSARRQLQESFKRAMAIESPKDRDQALVKIARESLKSDSDIAGKAFDKLTVDSSQRILLILYYMTRKMESDPEAAIAWAATLGSEKEIAAARAQILRTLKASDLERVAKLLLKPAVAGRALDATAANVLGQWAGHTPADAAAWLGTFPAGTARATGMATVASQWLVADSPAALSWMAALTSQADCKQVTQAMAQALANQPPPLRESLLAPADPKTRRVLEQQVAQIIREREMANPHPAAAQPEPAPAVTQQQPDAAAPPPPAAAVPEPAPAAPQPAPAPEPAPEPEPEPEPQE